MSLFLRDFNLSETPIEVKTQNKILRSIKNMMFIAEYNELMQKPALRTRFVSTKTAVSGGNNRKYKSVNSAEKMP